MGRKKLGDETVILRFKLPKELADKFRKRCHHGGRSKLIRYLIERWLDSFT